MPRSSRKPTNLSLDAGLVSAARELNVNVSRAAEEGIERAIRVERERLWRLENAEAIEHSNRYVERNGLPLAQYRRF